MIPPSCSTHWVQVRTVGIGRTSWHASISIAVLTRCVGPGDVTNTLETVGVISSTVVVRIYNTPVAVITYVAIWTVGIFHTLRHTGIIYTRLPWQTVTRYSSVITVNGIWPITHRTNRILYAWVEGQGPLALTKRIGVEYFLTISTFKEADFVGGTTFPKSAAVERVRVVIGFQRAWVYELTAIGHLTSVVG